MVKKTVERSMFTGSMFWLVLLILFLWPAGLIYYFAHREKTITKE